ncbi:hypothetical protein L596_015986 [Steinernema carpocapsae]|nr:hypothetical protein L596_015986 [Steinernema carpocapsae]
MKNEEAESQVNAMMDEKCDISYALDDKIWEFIEAFRNVRDKELPQALAANIGKMYDDLKSSRQLSRQVSADEAFESTLKEAESLTIQSSTDEEQLRKLNEEIEGLDATNKQLQEEIIEYAAKIRDYATKKKADSTTHGIF